MVIDLTSQTSDWYTRITTSRLIHNVVESQNTTNRDITGDNALCEHVCAVSCSCSWRVIVTQVCQECSLTCTILGRTKKNNSLLNNFLNTLRMNLVRLSRPYTCFAYSLQLLLKHDADAGIQVSPNTNTSTAVYQYILLSQCNGKPHAPSLLPFEKKTITFHAKTEGSFPMLKQMYRLFIFRLIYYT